MYPPYWQLVTTKRVVTEAIHTSSRPDHCGPKEISMPVIDPNSWFPPPHTWFAAAEDFIRALRTQYRKIAKLP